MSLGLMDTHVKVTLESTSRTCYRGHVLFHHCSFHISVITFAESLVYPNRGLMPKGMGPIAKH